jgi:putative transposase
MALDQSVLSELLDALRTGDGADLVRDAVRLVLQELIELEAAEVIGAGRYERTETRRTERNGHRPRLLSTQAGDVELKVPKLRSGSFFPSLLEPRRRIDQALYAVIAQAYVEGVSTRSVDDLVQALGIGSGISRSEVSRICARLDEQVGAFRDRPLGHVEFPYVYLDATYLKVRDPNLHQVVSKAVVVATGITTGGDREILGLAVGDSEAETFWSEFLRTLRHRGLGGVRLVISDAHDGLTKAIKRSFQGASWQRCRVHFARNVLAKVPKGSADMAAAALRTVFVHPDPTELSAAWDRVTDTFAGQFPKVTELMRDAKTDVLAFSAFPAEHWKNAC